MQVTYKIAMAAGQDAANRLKRAKGLKAWDKECAELALATFYKLMGFPLDD